jgi:imidazole glycerol phosphate synthase subunit HisF
VPRLQAGKALLGDLNKDGKMSGYETARQKAIEKSMKEQKAKKAMSGLAIGIKKIKNK